MTLAHQVALPLFATPSEGKVGTLMVLTCAFCGEAIPAYWQSKEVTYVERGTGFGQNTSYSHASCHRRTHKDTEATVGIVDEQAELWT